jgi:hypothetical protein
MASFFKQDDLNLDFLMMKNFYLHHLSKLLNERFRSFKLSYFLNKSSEHLADDVTIKLGKSLINYLLSIYGMQSRRQTAT